MRWRPALALAFGVASTLGAQDWRTLETSRQRTDTGAIRVRVAYGAGRLALRPTSAASLYDMTLRFDAEHAEPVSTWDAASRTLRLGTRQSAARMPGTLQSGACDIALTTHLPLDLLIELGAAEASLDLSAMRVRTLEVKSGASETTIRFDSAAVEPLERLSLRMGAASVKAYGLANAGAQRVEAEGGVGDLLLDYSGRWRHDASLELTLAIGKAVVRVPQEIGVRVETRNRWLNAVDLEGLVETNGGWETPNWNTATRRLRVELQSVLGTFRLERR